jgi:hypothetical protein
MSTGFGGPDNYFSIGGVTVQVPYADSSIPYSGRVRNISVCIAIQKMAETISDDSIRIALSSTAADALKEEVDLFVKDIETAGRPISVPT